MTILKDRNRTYGSFMVNSCVAQDLKSVFRRSPNWSNLSSDQKEALDQTASKISRLLVGDSNHIDSWEDISLYNRLITDRLKLENEYEEYNDRLGKHPSGYK